jgi:apolipoprotein N-acyltransferase
MSFTAVMPPMITPPVLTVGSSTPHLRPRGSIPAGLSSDRYDLSYTRVTDRLVKLGAEALIVPTMDIVDWGKAQHELHARVAPARATEYGLPIFRVASSGISQLVDRTGRVTATAPCPGDGAMLAGTLEMRGGGRRPLDRWLAPFATGVTAAVIVWLSIRRRSGDRPPTGEKVQDI